MAQVSCIALFWFMYETLRVFMCYPSLPLLIKYYKFVNNNEEPQATNCCYCYFNWLMALPMTIRLATHVSLTITSDTATLYVCKQQITSGNILLLVIH